MDDGSNVVRWMEMGKGDGWMSGGRRKGRPVVLGLLFLFRVAAKLCTRRRCRALPLGVACLRRSFWRLPGSESVAGLRRDSRSSDREIKLFRNNLHCLYIFYKLLSESHVF